MAISPELWNAQGALAKTGIDLQQVLDAIQTPVFMLEITESGEPVYVGFNRSAEAGIGRPRSEILGRTALDVYPGANGQKAYRRHLAVAEIGQPVSYELDLPLSGAVKTVRTTLTPIANDAGTVTHLLGHSEDISAARERDRATAAIATIQTEMEQFVALAAHDLRTPMMNVSTLAGLLREDFHDMGDGKLELIDMLEEVGVKASKLIVDVLEHAVAGEAGGVAETFDFGALCAEIITVLDPSGQHAFEHPDIWVTAERAIWQVVLRNLIDNALKHGGRAHLAVSITLDEAGPGWLRMQVRDDGCGIADPAAVFSEESTQKTIGGFGLAGVRRLVVSRGGTIEALAPADGAGALLSVVLPGQWGQAGGPLDAS